jgi:hypothetical protein
MIRVLVMVTETPAGMTTVPLISKFEMVCPLVAVIDPEGVRTPVGPMLFRVI